VIIAAVELAIKCAVAELDSLLEVTVSEVHSCRESAVCDNKSDVQGEMRKVDLLIGSATMYISILYVYG
jgi:hypothetical protein